MSRGDADRPARVAPHGGASTIGVMSDCDASIGQPNFGTLARKQTPTSTDIPDHDLAKIRRYAAARVPEHARQQLRYEITVRGSTVTIVERRAPGRADGDPEWTARPVAQLRWNSIPATWTLYWSDRRPHWHPYPHTPATTDVEALLAEINHDTTGAFWA